jgi:hypothetical protein
MALEHALPAGWVDAVFEAHRQKQYARELLYSTVVELTTLVSLGLRPSLHTAARQMPTLLVSLGSLYDKVSHTEPANPARAGARHRRAAGACDGGAGHRGEPAWLADAGAGRQSPAGEQEVACAAARIPRCGAGWAIVGDH